MLKNIITVIGMFTIFAMAGMEMEKRMPSTEDISDALGEMALEEQGYGTEPITEGDIRRNSEAACSGFIHYK